MKLALVIKSTALAAIAALGFAANANAQISAAYNPSLQEDYGQTLSDCADMSEAAQSNLAGQVNRGEISVQQFHVARNEVVLFHKLCAIAVHGRMANPDAAYTSVFEFGVVAGHELGSAVNVRDTPDGEVAFSANVGDRIFILQRSSGFAPVENSCRSYAWFQVIRLNEDGVLDGHTGWIREDFVSGESFRSRGVDCQ